MESDFDVLIIGGGMVGASLACALGAAPLRVGVVEAVPPAAVEQPSYDDRVVALALGSQRILSGVGVWDDLAADATPIRSIHVSDRGHFGFTRLRAEQAGVEALGFVLEARAIGRALSARLARSPAPELLCPAGFLGLRESPDGVAAALTVAGAPRTVSTRLLVAADGGHSAVREAAGIAVEETAYGQSAVIANVTPSRPHGGVAYERFTDSGPLALLPMSGRRCALVWTVAPQRAEDLLAREDGAFLEELGARFGERLGRFERVGRRRAYPLTLVRAAVPSRGRVVVVGNAAHTLHPVAGQGFNLGLRDVAVLAQLVVDAARGGGDPGAAEVLDRYGQWRQSDQRGTIRLTDTLVRLFSNDSSFLALGRNLGLTALDLLPGLKRSFAWRAMGLSSRQPRLARGLPL